MIYFHLVCSLIILNGLFKEEQKWLIIFYTLGMVGNVYNVLTSVKELM